MTRGLVHERPRQGETDTWLTPPWVYEALGPFDLDPCGYPGWPTAERVITLPEDGFTADWSGLVWLNPPYSQVEGWLRRLAEHPEGGIALVFARTETAAFQRWVWGRATSLLFPAGRIKFLRPDGSPGLNAAAPSVIVAYGADATMRLRMAHWRAAVKGAFVTNWRTEAQA